MIIISQNNYGLHQLKVISMNVCFTKNSNIFFVFHKTLAFKVFI